MDDIKLYIAYVTLIIANALKKGWKVKKLNENKIKLIKPLALIKDDVHSETFLGNLLSDLIVD